MKESAPGAGEAQSLSEMMGAGADETGLWEPEELAAILKHQLTAPIAFDLSYAAEGPPPRVDVISPSEGPSIETFSELFHHPRPPVGLLEQIKQFAKSCRNRANSPLPDEIASVLYTLSIIVAMTKCGRRITKSDDQTLRYGVDWALDQTWLDEPTRGLLEAWKEAS